MSVPVRTIRAVSLTSIIANDDHHLALWLRSRLRRTGSVRASYSSDLPVRRVQRPLAPGRSVVRWDLLGTAIDFRIRCAFIAAEVPPSVAEGVSQAGNQGGSHLQSIGMSLMDEYLAHVIAERPSCRGQRWLLQEAAEEHLSRLCYALAWFERVFRDGAIHPGSPLMQLDPDMDVARLLGRVPEHAVSDLQVQALLAERALGGLRDSTAEGDCRAAPTFAGSADVGGADADLLVGRRLFEIKSISHPTSLPDTAILQLAGYLLLDYEDAYRIRDVGFYMTRIGWLKTWPVEEFLVLLGSNTPVDRLRAEFANAAGGSYASTSDGQLVRRPEGPDPHAASGASVEE